MKIKRSIQEIVKREKRRLALGAEYLCDCDFTHDNRQNAEAYNLAKSYVEHFPQLQKNGMGLFIFGSPCSGKSYIAAEIVNELTDKGYNCLYTSLLTILNDLSTLAYENRRSYINHVCDRDLLVLDDLGAEADTSFSNQILMQIVNTCNGKSIPIIVTTPYHEESLKKEGGNPKRMLALSRLLLRSISYTVLMPHERRRKTTNNKRQAETLLKGEGFAMQQQEYEGFNNMYPEANVTGSLPATVQQSLPLA